MISVPLFLTDKHACSYLDGEIAQAAFVHPVFTMNTALYSALIKQGFRRSGDDVYAQRCQSCAACIPARLSVTDFKPNRSQKRCIQKNHATEVVIKPAKYEERHFQMYLRYQASRHKGGSMEKSTKRDYLHFLKSTWCETLFVEFNIAGELAGLTVVDQLDNALSAVYTFFDPKFSAYGLGVFAVLWQIEWAKEIDKEFVYLGFWIEQCKKMAYKSRYQPLQIYRDQQWSYLENTDRKSMDASI